MVGSPRGRVVGTFQIMVVCLVALVGGAGVAGAEAGPVRAAVETPPMFDDEAGGNADADDPAIWLYPGRPGASLVIATKKEGGLAVYDLGGREVQAIAAPGPPGWQNEPGRFNNVDLVYGAGPGGRDLAVVSDRGRDQLRMYAIDPGAGRAPLTDVTAADVPFVFSRDQAEVNEANTAYGLAAWRDGGRAYAFVSRRSRTAVAMVELRVSAGRAGYRVVSTLELPREFRLPSGQVWTPCTDPGDLAQVEGMVVDRQRGVLYAAQEDVGVWRVPVRGGFGSPRMVDRVREYGIPWTHDAEGECVIDYAADPGFGGRRLRADAEGLTIYYAGAGGGYLLVSSQGDDTFAVYERAGRNRHLGSFEIGDGRVDGVQESDGADVLNVGLGGRFEEGLLVVQDGANTPVVIGGDGEPRANTNFKLVAWDRIAAALPGGLAVDPGGWNPRD